MEKEVAPLMTQYWEKAEFPHEIIPKLAALGISGGTIKGYRCPGFTMTTNAMIIAEAARVDASICTFLGVHSYCAMRAIDLYGSEEQKHKYLPSLAEFKTIGCWGATEPDHGSEMNSLSTTATKVAGGWIINGQKRWIGNSTFADIFVICARIAETNKLRGFIVKKGAPGLQASKIENKVGLRIIQNGDILLKNVFVPDEDSLPGDTKGFTQIGEVMRLLVGWQALGIAMGAYDMCFRYLKQRQQFGAPLAAFQLNQQKLARMLSNIQAMFLVGWRASKLFDTDKLTSGHASMTKSLNTKMARETVALARELLGGNGILLDFHVAKAFCDLEGPYTYEGTYDMHTLIVGMEVLGIPSFGPPQLKKRSSL